MEAAISPKVPKLNSLSSLFVEQLFIDSFRISKNMKKFQHLIDLVAQRPVFESVSNKTACSISHLISFIIGGHWASKTSNVEIDHFVKFRFVKIHKVVWLILESVLDGVIDFVLHIISFTIFIIDHVFICLVESFGEDVHGDEAECLKAKEFQGSEESFMTNDNLVAALE